MRIQRACVTLLAIISLCLPLLVGCGGDGKKGANSGLDRPTTPKASPKT